MFLRGIIIAIFILAADQLHKYYMLEVVEIQKQAIYVTSFFNLVMVWNQGISFGMFNDNPYSQYIFPILSLVIITILLIWLKRTNVFWHNIGISFIIGGAIGNNLVDRIRFGAVADFFDFHIMGYHWPAFNIADMAIFLGALILCLDSIFCDNYPDSKKNKLDEKEGKK